MSEQEQQSQEPTVDEVLAGAAAATQAAQEVPLKPKKERKAKAASNGAANGANGEAHEAKPKRERKPKTDAEGNPIVTTPKGKAVLLKLGDADTTLEEITNVAVIKVLKTPESREGSKRAARAEVLKDGTLQDYFIAGGLKKDILRYMTTGVAEVSVDGVVVTGERQPKVPRPPKAEAEPKAEETGGEQQAESGGGEDQQQA